MPKKKKSLAERRAHAYLKVIPPFADDSQRNRKVCGLACLLVLDFDLSPDKAVNLLFIWGKRCQPRLEREQLVNIVAWANRQDGIRGSKLTKPSERKIEVNVNPDDEEIVVGVDCASAQGSYVDIWPTLAIATKKEFGKYQLCEELSAINWTGRTVIIAGPSNTTRRRKKIFEEFVLAAILRESGAEVMAARIASTGGKTTTYNDAQEIEIVPAPRTQEEYETLIALADDARGTFR